MTTQEATPATGQAVAEWAPSRDVALREWNADYRKLICNTVLKPDKREATAMELALFAEVAERSGLSPFMRQIFGVYRYDRRAGGEVMTIQVSIDGLRLIAERSGRYQGQTEPQWCSWDGTWRDVWLSDEPPAAARCGVHKAGMREPLYAVAKWSEFVQKTKDGSVTSMWQRMSAHMLSKCAEALALRKAFPAETSGLYTVDEPVSDHDPRPVPVIAVEDDPPAPANDQVQQLQALVAEVMGADLMGDAEIATLLVAHGASDGQDASTLPAEGVEAVGNHLMDRLAEAEAQDAGGVDGDS